MRKVLSLMLKSLDHKSSKSTDFKKSSVILALQSCPLVAPPPPSPLMCPLQRTCLPFTNWVEQLLFWYQTVLKSFYWFRMHVPMVASITDRFKWSLNIWKLEKFVIF